VRTVRAVDGVRIDVGRRRLWFGFLMPVWLGVVVGVGLVGMVAGEPPEDSGGRWFLLVWGLFPFDVRAGLRAYGIGGGTVAFDYGDRTIRLANVEEAEAKRVVTALIAEGLPPG
jgi:hypothetical protein